MADETVIMDNIIKQFKLIQNTRKKWDESVEMSGKLYTSLAYNLMRESVSEEDAGHTTDNWALDLVPQCAPACKLFLAGDPVGAAHLAAAQRIADDFDSLEFLLHQIRDLTELIEKAAQRLDALQRLKMNPNISVGASTSPPTQTRKKKSKRDVDMGSPLIGRHFPWTAIQMEAEVLIRRLRKDSIFREALVRALVPTVAHCTITGVDLGAPQRLCFLWREAHNLVKWENLLDLVEHLRMTVVI